MSAVEEYRKRAVADPVSTVYRVRELADAAIAELEAENTVAGEDLEAAKRDLQMEREWRGKAETELDALRKAGDVMEKGVGVYFGKDLLDPMNDARIAWHKLRERKGGK